MHMGSSGQNNKPRQLAPEAYTYKPSKWTQTLGLGGCLQGVVSDYGAFVDLRKIQNPGI